MIRKTLTILSLIGLLLSVGLWGASANYRLFYTPQSLRFCAVIWPGNVDVIWPDKPFARDSSGPHGKPFKEGPLGSNSPWCASPGIAYFKNDWNPGRWFGIPSVRRITCQQAYWFIIPHWMTTLLFGVSFVLLGTPLHRRRKRKKLGLCLNCGYDLRASKDRCPECGEEFVKELRSTHVAR